MSFLSAFQLCMLSCVFPASKDFTSFTDLWLEWDPRSWHPGSSQGKQSTSHKTFYSQRRELRAEDRWWGHGPRRCCLITVKIWWCNDMMLWHAMAWSTFVPFCRAILWLEGGILMILMIVCIQPAWYIFFLEKLAGPCRLKSGWWYQIIWTATAVDMAFSANSVPSRHLKTTMFIKSREDFEWPFLKVFLPFVLLGSACGFAAPEAKHLCTSQPAKATISWSSSSSRPRRPWMCRTMGAVASEEDLGGNLMRHGIPLWGSGWRCWWFKFVVITTTSFPRPPFCFGEKRF